MTSGIGEPVGAWSRHERPSQDALLSEIAGGVESAGSSAGVGPSPGVGPGRYQRQLALPGFGAAGQHRLGDSRMLVVGAGGLGSAAVTYLAAAGVGALVIVDDDAVQESNLPRQILYREDDLGHGKADRAVAVVRALNQHVQVRPVAQRLTADSATELVEDVDIVIDACYNWATRLILSQACLEAGRPHVWATIEGYRGQVSVWWPPKGPCLRCVFPDENRLASSSTPPAVLGPVAGLLGLTQASEAIKLVTGVGESLVGRLLLHDAAAARWDTIAVRPRHDCSCRRDAEPRTVGLRAADADELVAEILGIVTRVPAGRVVTYGDIAQCLPSGGPRQVGAVMAHHGQAVPWWRVVNASGRLPTWLASEGLQRWLDEGTPMRAGDPSTVNVGQARWVIDGVVGPR